MAENDQKQKKDNEEPDKKKSNGRVAAIGFWGGLIWSVMGFIAYYLNFTKYGPALIFAPWALGKWKNGLYGQLTAIVVIALLSILIAFVYKWTLGKVKTIWISAGFGVALWVIVFYIIEPWIPGLLPVLHIGADTISTSLCLYILYGLFIGYSISYDLQIKQRPDYSNE